MSIKLIGKIILIVTVIVILIKSFSVPVIAKDMYYQDKINHLQTSASHNLVTALQEKLKEKGYYKGKIDGNYDDDLDDALFDYRKANGLQKDKSLKKTLKSLGLINDN
jgi:N-acetylmuramoyl-L-alanine amidase